MRGLEILFIEKSSILPNFSEDTLVFLLPPSGWRVPHSHEQVEKLFKRGTKTEIKQ
jgi:hypothetical protein